MDTDLAGAENFNDNIKTVKRLIHNLVDDPSRGGLLDTPRRVAKFWQHMTAGYHQSAQEILSNAVYTVEHEDMVVVRDIEVYSLCEHHMLPFFGKCHVGYIPDGKIVGLSKIPRIIDIHARRLQVQERLGNEICETIIGALEPKGVGVVIEAHHLCMKMRGVQKQHSFTVTSSMRGCFQKDLGVRNEFISFIRSSS